MIERIEGSKMELEQFGTVAEVNITFLVDNRADLIIKSNEIVNYFTDKALLAEHGFSALVHFPDSGIKILWDAGVTQVALMENIHRMEIDPQTIHKIALSHGHFDHFAALTELLRAMKLGFEPKEWSEPATPDRVEAWIDSKRIPLTAHPAAFRERWWVKDDGTKVGPNPSPPRMEWEALGAKIELSEGPYRLSLGCWTTGYIPRKSFEKSGRPTKLLFREGGNFQSDDLEEDQAIVINVEGKGLVVLSGCAHSGIVNTIQYAREISGVDAVFAVLGGFHLARSNEGEIQSTIDALRGLAPEVLVPCHCTGFKAMCAFAKQLPDVFIPGVVGATYRF
jgi:7,8-dihydropterin-6-yl-methyl-4-(beta-D-ribofuranosyl)aminobenzene 5'-phosphate synthase